GHPAAVRLALRPVREAPGPAQGRQAGHDVGEPRGGVRGHRPRPPERGHGPRGRVPRSPGPGPTRRGRDDSTRRPAGGRRRGGPGADRVRAEPGRLGPAGDAGRGCGLARQPPWDRPRAGLRARPLGRKLHRPWPCGRSGGLQGTPKPSVGPPPLTETPAVGLSTSRVSSSRIKTPLVGRRGILITLLGLTALLCFAMAYGWIVTYFHDEPEWPPHIKHEFDPNALHKAFSGIVAPRHERDGLP